MSNNDNFQLYSQENKKESKKKKTRNKKNDIQKEDEIKVELIIKNNNKTESTQDKTKNNDLILPKIENNNTLKKTHENDINYYSKTKEFENIKNPKEKDNQNLTTPNDNKININNDNKNDKDINTEEKEKNFEIKEKKLIEIFNKNKKNLMQVCSEIEENLNKIYNSQGKDDDNILNKTQNINNSSNNNSKLSKEQKEIIKKINNYKKKIKALQKELDMQLKQNNIEELENTLKERKKHLENIKNENLILKNMKNLQLKDDKELKDILAKKEQLNSVCEKIIKMKDEAKIKKDYNHTLTQKLKSQNEEINNLQNRCKLINQNMAYYKEIKNNNENNYTENIDLNELKQSYEEKILALQKKQEDIIVKINSQNIKISELYNYNEIISEKIEDIIYQINENMKEITTYENELKKKEILLYKSLKKNKIKNTLSDRKPFHIGPINIKPKAKKIFDYQKYLNDLEKNKRRIKLYSSVDINAQPKTLREIEKLRTDIQQAIKKNELDDKIDKIIGKLKLNSKNLIKNEKNINLNNEEDDLLNNLFKKNEQINERNRYNFYVTEGANLPVPLKQESINKNLNSN
jgi:hypothetical protein